jgi:hypothetical protein
MHEFEELIVWLDSETSKVTVPKKTSLGKKGFFGVF